MQELPIEVREYLSSFKDKFVRAQLVQRYANLNEILSRPETRMAILSWLASDEAWEESFASFVANCLEFLRTEAAENEDRTVRTFLLHTDPYVRLRAYEFLLTLYFPDKNREAMFLLLHGMLTDNHNAVRAQAARYIKRANAVAELKDFLESWYKAAPSRGWDKTESFELVERLLKS